MANSNGVVCLKPRRVVNHFNNPITIRPSWFVHNNNQQMEACESKAGIDLLDIIRPKMSFLLGEFPGIFTRLYAEWLEDKKSSSPSKPTKEKEKDDYTTQTQI